MLDFERTRTPSVVGVTAARDRDEQQDWLSIADVARSTGLSAHTLRYYERAGLVRPIGRTTGGRRRYAESDLDWLRFLLRLRDTGMSIADMKTFAELRHDGASTVAARLALLREHHDDVRQRIDSLRDNLRHLTDKIDHYRNLLEENTS